MYHLAGIQMKHWPEMGNTGTRKNKRALKLGTPKFAFININLVTSKNNLLYPD